MANKHDRVERREVWIEMRYLAKWCAWYVGRKASSIRTSRPGVMFWSPHRGYF